MSYVDANGIEHVTASDEVSAWGNAHVACCPECAARWGASIHAATIPLAESGAEAERMLDGGAEYVVVMRRRRGADVTPR